jgi:hypothetical protein
VDGVTVDIAAVELSDSPPGADVRYRVRNGSDSAVWVVDDGTLAWHEEGDRITLDRSRPPMRAGAQPFGYFDPVVAPLEPGEALERTVELSWPQSLSGLWNRDREVSPASGEHELVVRIGYGTSPQPDPPQAVGESVEAGVLAWQRTVESEPARLSVP